MYMMKIRRIEVQRLSSPRNIAALVSFRRACTVPYSSHPDASAPHRAWEHPGHPTEGLCECAWLGVADTSRYLSYGEVSVGE